MLAISGFKQGRQEEREGTRFVNRESICVVSCVVCADSGENIRHALLQDGNDIFWEREENWYLAKASLPLQHIRTSSSNCRRLDLDSAANPEEWRGEERRGRSSTYVQDAVGMSKVKW